VSDVRSIAAQFDDKAVHTLKERARELGARDAETGSMGEQLEDVVVAVRNEVRYGFSVRNVREIRRVEVSRLPHAPVACDGLAHVRGEIFAVVDLESLRGARERIAHGAEALVMILELKRRPLAIRIDAIVGARTLYGDDRIADGDEDSAVERLVAYATRDYVNVIDLGALAAHSSFVHND